ncbi:MAG TPA: S8 family serine peptidase, partial [Holophaga sp.]|nr:S8 family serine peptidase [Holophaga sp.]
MDIVSFSSRGPTLDGRIKPDLMAPGTHVSGGAPQANKANPASSSDKGSALSCFLSNGDGVSGGPSSSLFFPTTQQWFTASSGTSHSTPAVSGACALVRQYFINQNWETPSPAMVKAYLMNSARYMTGTSANDTLPSNNQGMGLLDLGAAFDGTARILEDQAYTFAGSGDAQTVTGTISSSSKPFRVTLAWTDAPGSTAGNAWVNNLDLAVTVGGVTYKGNVFSGQYSTTGGSADLKNNVESVFLPSGTTGAFQVTVTATNVAGDGLTPGGSTPEQDYALVIYNGTETNVPSASVTGSTLTAENGTSNSLPDPGETVTYTFTFKNTGTAAASDLKVSLANSGGVTGATPASVDLGALAINGTATGSFTFTVDSATACGGTLTLTFTAVDGSTTLGTFTTTLTAGTSDCAPTITGFTPTAGFTGTSVTISGTKFTGATAVKFHGTSASSFTVNSASQITATAPSGFTNGTITVTT